LPTCKYCDWTVEDNKKNLIVDGVCYFCDRYPSTRPRRTPAPLIVGNDEMMENWKRGFVEFALTDQVNDRSKIHPFLPAGRCAGDSSRIIWADVRRVAAVVITLGPPHRLRLRWKDDVDGGLGVDVSDEFADQVFVSAYLQQLPINLNIAAAVADAVAAAVRLSSADEPRQDSPG
jgi:hypothetical protein